MKFINILMSSFAFTIANVMPQLQGSQHDAHNCVLDGGYQWCESLNKCVRQWETNCESIENPINNHPLHVIPKNCASWNDGCNTCDVNGNTLENCSENVCYMKPSQQGQCVDNVHPETFIPEDCLTWYDGCNTCSVNDGLLEACTMMYCFTTNDPQCTQYLNSELTQGDICYRFCEDGSQTMIDRSEDCPKGTECMPSDMDMISYDSCGVRAHRCIPTNSGH